MRETERERERERKREKERERERERGTKIRTVQGCASHSSAFRSVLIFHVTGQLIFVAKLQAAAPDCAMFWFVSASSALGVSLTHTMLVICACVSINMFDRTLNKGASRACCAVAAIRHVRISQRDDFATLRFRCVANFTNVRIWLR